MSRDGSDWDYINEHMGGHDEDGLPNFMSEASFSDDSYDLNSGEYKAPDYFENFQEAQKWARKNPGKVFVRSENGHGFVPKSDSNKYNNLPVNKRENQFSKQVNRFRDLNGAESVRTLTDVLSRFSLHLLYIYTNTPSNFSKNAFIKDLNKLNQYEILELKTVLTEYVEIDKQKLKGVESLIRQYGKNPIKYGLNNRLQWINDIESSIDLCG